MTKIGWWVLAGVAIWSPVEGQAPIASEEANQAMLQWLRLVAADGAEPAWQRGSFRFQYRITEADWGTWVANNRGRVAEAAATRRVLEFTVGHDEPPLPPLEWARAVYVRDRPAGGRLFERVVAVNEGGVWRVADFALWPDGAALVSNAGIDAVPYYISYNGIFLRDPEWRFHPRAYRPPKESAPPPPRPTNLANPSTFPRKPPPAG